MESARKYFIIISTTENFITLVLEEHTKDIEILNNIIR